MHSHLLCGIDDGVKTMEESIGLICELKSMGYRKLITTPHVMSDFYRNPSSLILQKLDELRAALAFENIDMEMAAAAEYYLDHEFIGRMDSEKLLTFGKNYLLFEISYLNLPDNLTEAVFKMQLAGYTPLLAHPERYPFWYGNFSEYERVKDSGVLFQLNINSLSGYYSPQAKRIAEKLIDLNMIDMVGSDLHHQKHLDALKRSASEKYFRKLLDSGKLLNPGL